jgi:hypothetical protein
VAIARTSTARIARRTRFWERGAVRSQKDANGSSGAGRSAQLLRVPPKNVVRSTDVASTLPFDAKSIERKVRQPARQHRRAARIRRAQNAICSIPGGVERNVLSKG